MFYKDSATGIVYDVPGKYDYEIILDPPMLQFMPNAEDESPAEAEGYTVFKTKKKRSLRKKEESVIGVWYSVQEPSTAARPAHAVRLLPPVRNSFLVPNGETTANVYAIPLYQAKDLTGSSRNYSATLLVFATKRVIFTSLQGPLDSQEIHVLNEQLLTEVTSHDASVQSLVWFRDPRNISECAFPNAVVDVEKDILALLLRSAEEGDHIQTSEERQTAILRRRKTLRLGVFLVLVALGVSFADNRVKHMDQEKLQELRSQDTNFQRSLAVQKKMADSYDFLVTSLKKQPDYTWTLLRLYGGTFGLTKRHFDMTLQMRKDQPVVIYSVTGQAFAKIGDFRPVIKAQLKDNGFVPKTITFIPNANLLPTITLSGEATLGVKQ